MLHTHSEYSPLDGLGRVKDIVERYKTINMKFAAITDHASINALPELIKHCKENNMKPVLGCEFYVVDNIEPDKKEKRNHLIVIAKNWEGVQSIMKMLSLANQQVYRRPRLSMEQTLEFKECIITSACVGGILQKDDYEFWVDRYKDVYGEDFYLEIMPHIIINDDIDIQKIVNMRALALSVKKDIKLIAANDAHYVNKEDDYTHKVLLAIQYNKKPHEIDWGDNLYHINSVAHLAGRLKELKYIPDSAIRDSIINIINLVEKTNLIMPKFEMELPKVHENDEDALTKFIKEGWVKKIKGRVNEKIYGERLIVEIETITKLGFIRYFLIVKDIIDYAKSNDIMVGPARGSAAGSLVCYLLGITEVDPIRFDLYFERFLNPDRIDFPDIDFDVQDIRRSEVVDYIFKKFGNDKTGQITTHNRLGLKQAFRDVCRVNGINILTVNKLSVQIEDEESFETITELSNFKSKYPEIIEQVFKLNGIVRQYGIHAAGVIVANKPLEQNCVLETRKSVGKKESSQVVNWSMNECQDFGLLKVDVLGLKTLSMLKYACSLVEKERGVPLDLLKVDLYDEETLEIFNKGLTLGVFQFESDSVKSILRDMPVRSFNDVVDANALNRPGSLNSGQTAIYVKVAKGEIYENYLHESLRPILSLTKGVMVYQEQIMQIFNQIGGFTWAESDKVRKVIGKSLGSDAFNKYKKQFLTGAKNKGVNEEISDRMFDQMSEFSQYAFNKSHSVAYTYISYWCAYLKAHYPLQFYTSALTFAKDETATELIEEAIDAGYSVRLPDINISEELYTVKDNEIILPLGKVKGVGNKVVKEILLARNEGDVKVFVTYDDFMKRVTKRIVNKGVIKKLTNAGVFRCFGIVEPNRAIRDKNYCEFIPVYWRTPKFDIDYHKIDNFKYNSLFSEITICSKDNLRKMFMPSLRSDGARVFFINAPVKNETESLQDKGSRYLLKVFKDLKIKTADMYYTTPFKCFTGAELQTKMKKSCFDKCSDFLKEEIRIVKPKVIVCCNAKAVSLFEKKKTISKLYGKMLYNSEYDAYVLFSPSPQHAFYRREEIDETFIKCMVKLKNSLTKG